MRLFYVDESGTGLKDRRSPFLVLAAFGLPAEAAVSLDISLTALKRRLVSWAPPEDFEIKHRRSAPGLGISALTLAVVVLEPNLSKSVSAVLKLA